MTLSTTLRKCLNYYLYSSILLFVLFLLPVTQLHGQIVPVAGATDCFLVGDGGVLMDPGGMANYPNCGCETVTTLCTSNDSPFSVVFKEFDVFATFDYLIVYEGNGTGGNELYNNSFGGANQGDLVLSDFIASNGSDTLTTDSSCMTFLFYASTVVDRPGFLAQAIADKGHPGDYIPCGASVTCLPPGGLTIDNITFSSADVLWNVPDSNGIVEIEYGIAGFIPGNGTSLFTTSTSTQITSLDEETQYQLYLTLYCNNGDTSFMIGPIDFETPDMCPDFSNITIDDVGGTTADISWSPSSGQGNYIIEYDTTGFALGTGNTQSTSDTFATIAGLEENTTYEFYVYLECDNGDTTGLYGPYFFQTFYFNDIGVVGFDTCDFIDNEITVLMDNFGITPQTLYEVKYAVNGELANIPVPIDGIFTDVLGMGIIEPFTFETEYDFSIPGTYIIQAWTELSTDSEITNDTFTFTYTTPAGPNFFEDFETGVLPPGWTTPGNFGTIVYAPGAHNNPTFVVSDNIYSFDPTFTLQSPRYAYISTDNFLSFDYRYVDYFAGTIPTVLGSGDSLNLKISTDCGRTYETIYSVNSTNHTTSLNLANISVPLGRLRRPVCYFSV